jgi:hypothetical protein
MHHSMKACRKVKTEHHALLTWVVDAPAAFLPGKEATLPLVKETVGSITGERMSDVRV